MIRLTRRERWLVIGLVGLVAAMVLFMQCISPAVERIETLTRILPQKQKELETLRKKSSEYIVLRTRLDNYKTDAALEEKGFELLAFLESIISEVGLEKKLVTMKQQLLQLDSNYYQTTVEAELKNLTIKELLDFLLKTRSSKHFLWIKSLYAEKQATNPDLLDVVIQISTLRCDG